MPWTNDTDSTRRRSALATAGIALSAILALASFAGAANAHGNDRDDHRGQRQDHREGWTGGYYPYPAPPVVYGEPYGGYGYYPQQPPVVYGPAVGIALPGVSIGIR